MSTWDQQKMTVPPMQDDIPPAPPESNDVEHTIESSSGSEHSPSQSQDSKKRTASDAELKSLQKKQKRKQQKQKKALMKEAARLDPVIRWDVSGKKNMLDINRIKKFHIYDFDNTLFKSPTPNMALFDNVTMGMITSADHIATGGWWKNVMALRNVGEGWALERPKAWEGFWNEDIVDLLKMSIEDDDTLTIVMTGRRKELFTTVMTEMLKSRGLLEGIDGLMLKTGKFETTIEYKTQVIVDILDHFKYVNEVTIYDDRKSQLNGFMKCLNEYTEAVRPTLISNMIPVFTEPCYLDPKTERQVVENMLDEHNALIEKTPAPDVRLHKVSLKKGLSYTSYRLFYDDRAHVIDQLIKRCPDVFTEQVFKTFQFQVDHIPVVRGKISRTARAELGDEKQVIQWKITSIASNESMIGVIIEPVTDGVTVKTLLSPSVLPIASLGKSSAMPVEKFAALQDWQDVPGDEIRFSTQLMDIVKLRIVHEGGRQHKTPKGKNNLKADLQSEAP